MNDPLAASGTRPVEVAFDGSVAVVRLNRPHRLNAVNPALVDGLLDALARCADAAGRREVGAVVLTGNGRAFCAGHDLKEPREQPTPLAERLDRLQEVTRRIRALPVPVIAAVRGHAVGAGAEFALGCDLVIAAEDAAFRFPEVGIGLSVTGGVSRLLPALVGPAKAKELVLLGEPVPAREAERIGLVNRVVPADGLLDATLAWARRLASQPPLATSLAKTALDEGTDGTLPSALALEIAHALVTDAAIADEESARAALTGSRARST
ncbi:enoyl-CoA hydratase/isomerase family protein [Actinomadura logoneensis]|uniref:enoyl-CoA hydratase/isomerase family protein n=1 Tax=Actinomadura logoneensis TaxID=2293572 RepID=UPI001F2AE829|nr:enoyl-CoA hydratase/isomerase family protein [Actinomadura logoneensis]